MSEKFLWGSATAAYQCEGGWDADGKGASVWDDFCHSEANKTGITGDVSCDFYHHYKEDIRMMAESGQNTLRFSMSWSRILPKDDHVINQAGLDFYDRVLDELEKYHIVPNVTLIHYDLPDYIGKKGGWLYENVSDEFAYYASVVFKHFGDRVPLYATINEPDHTAFCGCCAGNYPPNETNLGHYVHCAYNMMMCTAKAVPVREFKKLNLNSKVGIVQGTVPASTLKKTPEYQQAIKYCDIFSYDWVLDPAIRGHFSAELIKAIKDKRFDLSFSSDEDLEIIRKNTIDFLGQNIYSRKIVNQMIHASRLSQ